MGCKGKTPLFLFTLNYNTMRLKIEFQDKNHNVISIHNIEYNTITPPYMKAYDYCEQIMHYYRDVWFFCVTKEN